VRFGVSGLVSKRADLTQAEICRGLFNPEISELFCGSCQHRAVSSDDNRPLDELRILRAYFQFIGFPESLGLASLRDKPNPRMCSKQLLWNR